jgi:hypothetical protein
MGVKAYQVRRQSDPMGSYGGPIQVTIHADNPEAARLEGAALLDTDPRFVTVQEFMTRGSVPGGDQAKYREAQERWQRGEQIRDGDEPV